MTATPDSWSSARIFDLQDGGAGVPTDPTHLRNLLRTVRTREPCFFEVRVVELKLLIGAGGDHGCAQHGSLDGEPPYLMAIDPTYSPSTEPMSFLIAGTSTEVDSRYRLGSDTLLTAIDFFIASDGGRYPGCRWEAI
jgi:hypothetical protein